MENSSFDNFDVQLSEGGRHFLRITAKWATFLSIVGFVFSGFAVLGALGMFTLGSFGSVEFGPLGSIGGMIFGFIYLIGAALCFFPAYYLFQFSSRIRRAFEQNDSIVLNDGLGSLKSYFKYLGIFVIILIALYLLLIVGVIAAGISGGM